MSEFHLGEVATSGGGSAGRGVPVAQGEDTAVPARDRQHAYLLLRLLTGLNFFGHGYARLFTGTFLQGFVDHTVQSMAKAPLAPSLVAATAYCIPVVELIVGVMLLTGFFVRWALYLAFLLMFVLMFGTTMAQNWPVAGDQLVYGLVLAVLLFGRIPYDLSWSGLLRRRRA